MALFLNELFYSRQEVNRGYSFFFGGGGGGGVGRGGGWGDLAFISSSEVKNVLNSMSGEVTKGIYIFYLTSWHICHIHDRNWGVFLISNTIWKCNRYLALMTSHMITHDIIFMMTSHNSFRPLVKECITKNDFLISQPKHMLWVLKRNVSGFYWAPKTYVINDG